MNHLFFPIIFPSNSENYIIADQEVALKINEWFNDRIEYIHNYWLTPYSNFNHNLLINPNFIADKIIGILIHRDFNYQSKTKLISILPAVRQNLIRQIITGRPINFFLLYNGGYRASSLNDGLSLIFNPDQTELMLLYQITLLNEKINSIYLPGVNFVIVINNGVANWVNEIPYSETENYVNQLRKIIENLGASYKISVLLQSEIEGHSSLLSEGIVQSDLNITETEHRIVERFLGRHCSREEAKYRITLYKLGEANWEETLSSLAQENDCIMLRQVAHPDMLSFRPFPGGAIRIQNGTFGFEYVNNNLKPKLITSESIRQLGVTLVPYSLPKNILN